MELKRMGGKKNINLTFKTQLIMLPDFEIFVTIILKRKSNQQQRIPQFTEEGSIPQRRGKRDKLQKKDEQKRGKH